jgi:hypothetical protein
MLKPIREIVQFMNWADVYVVLRLGCWPLHIFMHMMCKFVTGTTNLHIICIKI